MVEDEPAYLNQNTLLKTLSLLQLSVLRLTSTFRDYLAKSL